MEDSPFYLEDEVEGLGRMGDLDAGELSADRLLDRLVVELHGFHLLGEVGVAPLDVDGVAHRKLPEIDLYGGYMVLFEKFYDRADALFHEGNDSINPLPFQGKTGP